MKSKINNDVVLFNEIRHSLNKETQLLDMATRSKLTQMRFNAIDHALPVQQTVINQDRMQWGIAAAVFVVMLTVFVVANFPPTATEKPAIAWGEEDTDEALEMYEWLYNNYG